MIDGEEMPDGSGSRDLTSRGADIPQENFADEPDKEAPTESDPESNAD